MRRRASGHAAGLDKEAGMTREALAAIRLMRMALALLDKASEPIATARLPHAIDGMVA